LGIHQDSGTDPWPDTLSLGWALPPILIFRFQPTTNKSAVAQEQNTLLAKLYEYAKAWNSCQLPPLGGSGL